MSQPSPRKMLKTSNPFRSGPLKEICVNKMRDKGVLELTTTNSTVTKPLKNVFPYVSINKCIATVCDVNKATTKVTNVVAAQKENYPNIQRHSPKKTSLGSVLTNSGTKIQRLSAIGNIQKSATPNVIKIRTKLGDDKEWFGTSSDLTKKRESGRTIVNIDVEVKSELEAVDRNLSPMMLLVDDHKRGAQVKSTTMSTPKSSKIILTDGPVQCSSALTFRKAETSVGSTNSSNKISKNGGIIRDDLNPPFATSHEDLQTPISISLADHSATILPVAQSLVQPVSSLVSKSVDPDTTVSSSLPEVSTIIERSSPTRTNGTTLPSVPSNTSGSLIGILTGSIGTNLPASTPSNQNTNASFLSSTPTTQSPFYASRVDSHSSFLQTTPNSNFSFLSTTPNSSTSISSSVSSSPVSLSSSFEGDISSPLRSNRAVESGASLELAIVDPEEVASDILCSPAGGRGTVARATPSAPPLSRRNARERNRVRQVSQGFAILRQHVPQASRRKKLSKVETLRCAVDYIRALSRMIEENNENTNASLITSSSSLMTPSVHSSSSSSLPVQPSGSLTVKTLNYPFSYALQTHPQLQPLPQTSSNCRQQEQQEQQVNSDYHQQQLQQQQQQQKQTQQTLLSMASSFLVNAPVVSKQAEQRGPMIVASEQRGVHTNHTHTPTPSSPSMSVEDASTLAAIDPLVFKLPGTDKGRITEEYGRYARYADVVFNPTPDTSSDFSGTSSLGLTPGGASASSSFSLDLSNISSPSRGHGSSSFGLSDPSSSESPTTGFMKSTSFEIQETPAVLRALGSLKSNSSIGIPGSLTVSEASSSQSLNSSSVSMLVHTGDIISESSCQDPLGGDDTDQESELMDCLSWWQETP